MSPATPRAEAGAGQSPRRGRLGTAIVVGAGFAGLAAALRLRAHGFDVTLLEREAAPGGQARPVALGGTTIDPCATLLSTSDVALRSLLDVLARPEELEPWPEGSVCRADAADALHPLAAARPSARRPGAGVGWLGAMRSVRLDRLAARYARRLDRTAPERGSVLDDRSAADWARLYFGQSVLASWVAPWLASSIVGEACETSRLLFLLQYASGRRASAASLRAGPGALAAALAARVPTRFGVEVERVERAAGGLFEVHGRSASQALRVAADAVILALPPAAAQAVGAALLSSAEKDHLASVRRRPALSVVLSTQGELPPPVRRIVVSHPGRALRVLQLERAAAGPGPARALVAVASAAFARQHAQASDDTIVRRIEAEVERVAPRGRGEIRASRVVRWSEELPCFDVGHYRALERVRRVEAWQRGQGRRLALAGAHLQGPRLEDAVVSGFRAADALAG